MTATALDLKPLSRWLERRFGRSAEIEDIVQEAYLRYLQQELVADDPLKYIAAIAANLTREIAHKNKRRAEVPLPELVDLRDPYRALAAHEDVERLLRSLPQNYRTVLILVKRDGLKYYEVAQKLGIAEHTVLTYLARAMGILRRSITKPQL